MSFQSGTYRHQNSGTEFGYQYFIPNKINRSFTWSDTRINILLEQATHAIGQLQAYSSLVPDINFFISMHVVKEATSSSKIEGTKTGVNEAVLPEEEIDPERRDDWQEVQNYITAMHKSISRLQDLPLSMRLLNEAHKHLMHGVRGEHKLPGEVRKSQNWIGGSNLRDAYFIPPHHDELGALLGDLEKFWHNDGLGIPHLIKAAISHYHFETIHPYLDGNGRIGRLLITLYLIDKHLLDQPTLYLSDFIERNRSAYYDSLTLVRTMHDMEQWIRFFLTGVIEVSQRSQKVFQEIISLQKTYSQRILELGRRGEGGSKLQELLYSKPIVNVQHVADYLGVTYPTASDLITDFVRMGILVEQTGMERHRLFAFREYLKLFE